MFFKITYQPISEPLLPKDITAGALVVFEGTVRQLNDGKHVKFLTYEADPELAISEGEKIMEEILIGSQVVDIACVHRVGKLELGDVAVRVEVLATHRKEAFDACARTIDQVKLRVPIWKKESYENEESSWLGV